MDFQGAFFYEPFSRVMKAMNRINDLMPITLSMDGIYGQCRDVSNVMAANVRIPKKMITDYQFKKEKSILDVESLNNHLNLLKNENISYINFNFENQNDCIINSVFKNYSFSMKEYSDSKHNIYDFPKFEYKNIININAQDLNDSIKYLGYFNEHLVFKMGPNEDLIIKGMTTSEKVIYSKIPNKNVKMNISEKAQCGFNKEYLKLIFESLKPDDVITFYFKENFPLVAKLKIEDIELEYIIAPRVER